MLGCLNIPGDDHYTRKFQEHVGGLLRDIDFHRKLFLAHNDSDCHGPAIAVLATIHLSVF